MEAKCTKCGKAFTDEPTEYPYPGKIYEHRGEAVCETCLIGMGVLPDHKESSHARLLAETNWSFIKPV